MTNGITHYDACDMGQTNAGSKHSTPPTCPWFLLQRAGSLEAGMAVRAVDKHSDFILLETDVDNAGGGGQGVLGWADASCVVPAYFPSFYEFGSELPDAVRSCGSISGGVCILGGPYILYTIDKSG